MPPPSAPIKKKKFVWSDADENEIKDYCKYEISFIQYYIFFIVFSYEFFINYF